ELRPVDSGCRVSHAEMKAELSDMRVRLAEAKRELELLREQREKELKEIAMEGDKPSGDGSVADATGEAAGESGNESSGSNASNFGGNTGATSASDPQDRFLLTIRRFVVEAAEQYEALLSQFNAMEEAYSNSVLLYGEDPRTMAPEEFFGIFKTFTASFNQVSKDNNRERERKRNAEKRRKQIEAQIEQKRMVKENRANRLATGASRIREQINTPSQESANISMDSDDIPGSSDAAESGQMGGENGAVDDLLKSLMAGTDLERVEATKRRRRRELMSIRRRSSVRRSVHRTSISIKALQMLRDIKEDEEGPGPDALDEFQQVPPLPSSSTRNSLLRRQQLNSSGGGAEWMSPISEDEMAADDMDTAAERRAARRRQLLED
ncbi:hypothetical protein GGF37_002864, partial [Kickxella alabastrina]